MIIRSGFVSNSSSSSFILRVPKDGNIPNMDYVKYFGIKEKNPIELQKKVIGLMTGVLANYSGDEYYGSLENVREDPKDLLDYYIQYRSDNEKFNQFNYEANHPEEFPDTKIIAFEADDNSGDLVCFEVAYSLSNSHEEDFDSDNILVINEH